VRVAYSVPEEHELVAHSWYPRRWSCLDRAHPATNLFLVQSTKKWHGPFIWRGESISGSGGSTEAGRGSLYRKRGKTYVRDKVEMDGGRRFVIRRGPYIRTRGYGHGDQGIGGLEGRAGGIKGPVSLSCAKARQRPVWLWECKRWRGFYRTLSLADSGVL